MCHSVLSMVLFHRWLLHWLSARHPSASGAPQIQRQCDHHEWAQYSSGDYLHKILFLRVAEMFLSTYTEHMVIVNKIIHLKYLPKSAITHSAHHSEAVCYCGMFRLSGFIPTVNTKFKLPWNKALLAIFMAENSPNTFLHQYVHLNLH